MFQGQWWKAHEIYQRQQNLGHTTFDASVIRCKIEKPEAACLSFDVGKFGKFVVKQKKDKFSE